MTLEIVKYGNPVLRQKGTKVEKITPELQDLIDDMFETMRASRGVGLAAQQIGKAMQLTVLDVTGMTDRPSTLELNGKPADVNAYMPLVLINPELKPYGNTATGPEGCLSFPEMYADISRPEMVEVKALNRKGEVIEFSCGGLLARAIQHEVDHLNGYLFIDRMSTEDREAFKPELEDLKRKTKEGKK